MSKKNALEYDKNKLKNKIKSFYKYLKRDNLLKKRDLYKKSMSKMVIFNLIRKIYELKYRFNYDFLRKQRFTTIKPIIKMNLQANLLETNN